MNKQEVIKGFRKARIEGEKKLTAGEISWEQFCFIMTGFELQLGVMGVSL